MQIKTHYASFSEAIREGCLLGRQTFDRYGGAYGSACAIGAGLRASGFPASAGSAFSVLTRFYSYMRAPRIIACPDCVINETSLQDAVMHLNDYHRWARERIADWLETEEEKLGYITLIETEPHNEMSSETTVESRESFAYQT